MITEKELEQALELRKDIREMKLKITRLEDIKISRTEIGASFSIDSNRINVDEYTIGILTKFKKDILKAYGAALEHLEQEYKGIIVSEEDAIEHALFGGDDD